MNIVEMFKETISISRTPVNLNHFSILPSTTFFSFAPIVVCPFREQENFHLWKMIHSGWNVINSLIRTGFRSILRSTFHRQGEMCHSTNWRVVFWCHFNFWRSNRLRFMCFMSAHHGMNASGFLMSFPETIKLPDSSKNAPFYIHF